MTTSSPSLSPNIIAHFARSLWAMAIARAFTPPPDIPIADWSDQNVWLQNEDAAEPGPYRSAKTIWTRRIQELPRHPFMWVWDYDAGSWTKVRVKEVNVQKSTQSGFTEAVLNVIRWLASFFARNVIYAIDSLDEAKKIARRLLRSLKFLDPGIFTGDPDDIKTTEFLLRGMELLFIGSFSPGKFANKQAYLVVTDELEEHGGQQNDTSTSRNLSYRKKTQKDGLAFNLSKPKLENGPINKLWKRGNREEFHIRCPHCSLWQFLTHRSETYDSPFTDQWITIMDPDTHRNITLPVPLPRGETRKVTTGRLVADHCKDLLGNVDELRLQRPGEVYYECPGCKGRIEESRKQELALEAAEQIGCDGWVPTAIGTPGVISQHMSDILSTDENSLWGALLLELATAKKEGRQEIQGVINNRFGNAWREELSKTEESDIRENVAGTTLWLVDIETPNGNQREVFTSKEAAEISRRLVIAGGSDAGPIIPSYCKPYKRGNIPFAPAAMILGSDVGGNYARWAVLAAMENMIDLAVIDWGDELDPETIAEIMLTHTWPCLADGKRRRLGHGFIDAKFDKTKVLQSCWYVFKQGGGHRLIPLAGIGGAAARGVRVWAYTPISGYGGKFKHSAFKKLDFNDRESKNDLYIGCIAKKQRRCFFPVELGKKESDMTLDERQFVQELCAEELLEDKHGRKVWKEFPSDPNHYGDAVKNGVTGFRFLTRKHHRSQTQNQQQPQ